MPLAIEFEGTPSVALAYVSLVVLLLPLLVCCYSSYRSLGPLLPPKLSRVEDEVLPWIVRATESGADAATHAAEGRLGEAERDGIELEVARFVKACREQVEVRQAVRVAFCLRVLTSGKVTQTKQMQWFKDRERRSMFWTQAPRLTTRTALVDFQGCNFYGDLGE